MKHFLALSSVIVVIVAPSLPLPAADAAPPQPNIILILADDMGYGDVGVLFQNSRDTGKPRFSTPQLDRMASEGCLLTQHYTGAPVCAPARTSLLLGQHQGNCAVRDNQFDKALPDNHTLATVLKQAGYRTIGIGKWGLAGNPPKVVSNNPDDFPAHPLRRGFDEFFGYLEHNSGHTYYHDAKNPLREGWDNVTEKYLNIYSTDLFTARAKKFIVDHEKTEPGKPFFMFLAYTAIHTPLKVPGKPYPMGRGVKGGVQWPPRPTPDTRDTWLHPDYAEMPWTDPMKRYATMARRLDDGIGDLLQVLRDLHIADRTLVIFTSDNGPAGESGSDPRAFDSWGPFDGFKRDCWEGGVREPAIAWWPGHIPAKSRSDVLSGFWDWMPTFADLAGLAPPAQSDGVSLVPALTGNGTQRDRGYVYGEYFSNSKNPASEDVFARKNVTGRGQQQFLRIGDWVAIRTQIESADTPIRLYNITKDPHQDHDMAGDPENEKLVSRMKEMLLTVRRPDPDAPRPYDGALLPAVTATGDLKDGVEFSLYEGKWPWLPDFDALTPIRAGSAKGLDLSVLEDASGVRFSGLIEAPSDGNYTFRLTSDSGAQMWIHDSHIIGDDFHNATGAASASVPLRAGLHPFRIFYRRAANAPLLKLEYSTPGSTAMQSVSLKTFRKQN